MSTRLLGLQRASPLARHQRRRHVPRPTAAQQGDRLFSNLDPATLRHQPGSVWGAAALVAGTTVGAGVLALPAVTAQAGFAASAAALTACCGYSLLTGLLVAEVSLNTLCELGAGRGVSLASMARRTLGDGGAAAVSLTYALLHYTLLVAYVAKAGETVAAASHLPLPLASAGFAAACGGLCYATRPRQLDAANSVLVAGVVATFLGLLAATTGDVHPAALARADWGALPAALPVIALAFVYQNVVPVVASSLEGDPGKVRTALAAGITLPYLMFMAWEAAVLGSGSLAAQQGGGTGDPLAALRSGGSQLVGGLIDAFTLLAIATSYIGFVLGLTEFIADALQLPTGSKRAVPYLLTILPPLALALSFPGLFLEALDFAGTYGVLVLFGLVPAAMAWSERYCGTTLTRTQLVPGGKPVLVGVAAAAAAVIGDQLLGSLHGGG